MGNQSASTRSDNKSSSILYLLIPMSALAGLLVGRVIWRSDAQPEQQVATGQIDPRASERAREGGKAGNAAKSGASQPTTGSWKDTPTVPTTTNDPEADHLYREQQAKELMSLLQQRESGADQQGPFGGDAEFVAAQVAPYMQGVLDAIGRTAPEVVRELSKETEATLCDSKAKLSMQLVAARMAAAVPELTTSKSVDCVLSREKGEDVLTWQTLDAWRVSGLPKTQAIDQLAEESKDPRTLYRLGLDDSVRQVQRPVTEASPNEQNPSTR